MLKKQDDENEIIQNNPEIIQNNPEIIQNNPEIIQKSEIFKCEYCDDIFTFFTNKRRHELHRCKKNPLVLKTLIDKKAITISDIEKKHETEKKQLYNQIELLLQKVGNTTNIINNTQNTQNIQLNNYGNEDLSHITDKLKESLIKMPYGMIPKLIEAVHFNDNMPCNKNIILPNKKDNKLKIYNGKKWIYKNKEEVFNDLMDGKYFILDNYYEDHNDLLTRQNKNNYDKFRTYFDDKDTKLFDQIKKECELIILNNR
jgi:hypothetical protein